MNARTYVRENGREVLQALKGRFPVYHLSNVFFRDIQYGIQSYLAHKGMKVRYPQAERLACEFVEQMEKLQVLVPLDKQTWVVRLEEFKTPAVLKTPAKPAADRPAAPSVPRATGQATPAPSKEA